MTRRRVLGLGAGLATTAILAACGDPDEEENGNGTGSGGQSPTATPGASDPTATSAPDAPEYPTGAGEVVIRIATTGGFVPPEEIVRQFPMVSLFGDGRMIVPGPVIEIYPPPALLPLLETAFNEEGMARIVQQILDTGLFDGEDKRYDTMFATDLPDTVFTVNAGGESTTISVYGLGAESEGVDLPDEEREARQTLLDLQTWLASAPQEFPADLIAEPEHDYEIERLQLVTFPYAESGVASEPEPGQMDWPLETPPDEIGEPFAMPSAEARCVALGAGADLETMLGALREANQLTKWTAGEESYFLINRPLLPDEEECVSPFEGMDPDGQSGAIEHPTGEDELVLRYEIAGGFVPIEYMVTSMPVASLYGQGAMITPGPQIMIYPGPALPALNLEKITEEGIQMILAEAEAAGLLQGEQVFDKLGQVVADAGTGVLTIHANGERHRVEVYAPGMGELQHMGDVITEEEIAFREKFDAFTGKLTSLSNWLPQSVFLPVPEEYPAKRLQLVSQPAELAPVNDPQIDPGHMEWPLDTPLSELGEPYSLEMSRCFVLEGEEFATVMSLLNEATQITRWDSDGQSYVLHVRPLLPDEPGCVDPFS